MLVMWPSAPVSMSPPKPRTWWRSSATTYTRLVGMRSSPMNNPKDQGRWLVRCSMASTPRRWRRRMGAITTRSSTTAGVRSSWSTVTDRPGWTS